MSAQTRETLDAAIRAHVADEHPDNLVGSWVTIYERVLPEDDGMTHIVDVVPEGQSVVTTVGLTHFVATNRAYAPREA